MMSDQLNGLLDSAAGKAQDAHGESLSSFVASLTSSVIILCLGIAAYTFLRLRFRELYSRRAFWDPRSKWTPIALTLRTFFSPMPDPALDDTIGLDNYFFDRYLHTIVRIFVLLGLIIPTILLPLNLINGRNQPGGVTGLDRLSFSNISPSHTGRYWAHLLLAILVAFSVCSILQHEIQTYNRLRRTLRASGLEGFGGSSSVLLVSNSKKRLSTDTIGRHFHNILGGVCSIVVNRDYGGVRAKVCQRDKAAAKLEIAETKLIIKANRQRVPRGQRTEQESKDAKDELVWTSYLSQKDRPSMRLPVRAWLPPLPFLGRDIDEVFHLRTKVARLNLEIESALQNPDKFPESNSAFVSFNERLSMPLAALALKTRLPTSWTLKQGTAPKDTIWKNVSVSWWQQFTRAAVAYLMVAVLTLGFAIPVTVAGTLSQIRYLASATSWLNWIESLPGWVIAVAQGVLPQATVSVITGMVPPIFRLLADTEGIHSRQVVESHVQVFYFTFLFVQVFLMVSLSAGFTTIAGQLSGAVSSVPLVLAQNLPKASNYFFSSIMIYTFTTIADTLLQLGGFIQLYILSPWLDTTPRQIWDRRNSLDLQAWGTFIPVLTNIACIGLVYSVIAPAILFFSAFCFGVLWLLYRAHPPKLAESDFSKSAMFYPTAIRQLFTGVYFMELCLTGLFLLVRDTEDKASCTAQAVIMMIATVLTALFHCTLNCHYRLRWLVLRVLYRHKPDQTVIDTVPEQAKNGPMDTPVAAQKLLGRDDVLISRPSVLWIPKDGLGVSDDEIYDIMRTKGLWASNKSAYLEGGRVRLQGPPP